MRPSVQKFMTIAAAGMVAIALVLCGYFAATSLTPATVSASTASEWNLNGRTVIDLSHIQDQTIPADPALKKPTLEFFAHVGQGEGAYWNLETVSYCPHTGTHMEAVAPVHITGWWRRRRCSCHMQFIVATCSTISVDDNVVCGVCGEIQA